MEPAADTFISDRLPARILWPEMDYEGRAALRYPERLNVVEQLVDRWLDAPERPAILFGDEVWTYGRLASATNQIARVLVEDYGLRPGNRVLLRSYNHPFLIAALLGTLRAGGIAVPTMPSLRTPELAYLIERANISFAISQQALSSELQAARLGSPLEHVLLFGEPEMGLERAAMAKSDVRFLVPTRAEDPALIAFTSGTTGRPKGTIHFHRDLLAVADTFAAEVLTPSRDDVFCGTPQVAFLYGLCAFVPDAMRFGAAVALEERLRPEAIPAFIARHQATVCFTTPSGFHGMLQRLGEADISSLRLLVAGGEPLPEVSYREWTERTGVPVINGLGVSELLHIFVASRQDRYKHGYVGLPVPGYEVRICDELGQERPPGEIGYLFVKGPTGCRYLDDPERQRSYVVDGWNRTGDLCQMDDEGFVAYVGRSDDMIVTSGYNVSPLEVEDVLLQHPLVKECAVVGVPDAVRTNLVAAFVVARECPISVDTFVAELGEFARQHLAGFKCPRRIEVWSDLPRTHNGKVQRNELRKLAAAGG